jgi:hypothetical protein
MIPERARKANQPLSGVEAPRLAEGYQRPHSCGAARVCEDPTGSGTCFRAPANPEVYEGFLKAST